LSNAIHHIAPEFTFSCTSSCCTERRHVLHFHWTRCLRAARRPWTSAALGSEAGAAPAHLLPHPPGARPPGARQAAPHFGAPPSCPSRPCIPCTALILHHLCARARGWPLQAVHPRLAGETRPWQVQVGGPHAMCNGGRARGGDGVFGGVANCVVLSPVTCLDVQWKKDSQRFGLPSACVSRAWWWC